MYSKPYMNEPGGMNLDCDSAEIIHQIEVDADCTLDDSVPWEYSEGEDDPE